MDPIVTTVLLSLPRILAASLLKAAIRLIIGALSAVLAAGLYVVFLSGHDLGVFYSSTVGATVGILLALVVDGGLKAHGDLDEIRAGPVGLTGIGLLGALIGQLVGQNPVANDLLFAVSRGGMVAGFLGIVLFLGFNEDQKPNPDGIF